MKANSIQPRNTRERERERERGKRCMGVVVDSKPTPVLLFLVIN
jgi:hypothetical protein